MLGFRRWRAVGSLCGNASVRFSYGHATYRSPCPTIRQRSGGLGERVIFAGLQRDVAPWLAALDVFALPSYANEGVPQALLQAMVARVPCVTTSVGGIPEIARDGETARVVPATNAKALAAAID